MRKIKEKLKIHLANGTVRVSNLYIKQSCVTFGERAKFLDFSMIKLSKYEAILGKPRLDWWNPEISWKMMPCSGKWGAK